MNNLTVNEKKNVIVMGRDFAKRASVFGTDEYDALQKVRRDYPNLKVVTKAKSKSGKDFKGLTFDYMEEFIKGHDENGSIMAEYLNLRGLSAEAKDIGADSLNYQEIKEWFFGQYPQVKAFHENRAQVIAKVRANAAA